MYRIFYPLYLVILFLSLSYNAVAESSVKSIVISNTALQEVERLTITATRQEKLDTDLAMSVQSIGKALLDVDNGQHVAESLNSVSGVMINQLSGGQGHKTAIRMPMNTSGYYLYLQDNVPLQSTAFFNHNGLWWSSFNSNVARIEVLKGAGTALYGSGAVAAIINIISENVADTTINSANIMLGEDDYKKLQFSHSNAISEQQGVRVSASYLTNDGWRDHTASKRAELTVRHEYEISANQRLTTSLILSDLEQEMAASLSTDLYNTDKTNSGLSDDVLTTAPLRNSQYLRLATQWELTGESAFYSIIPYVRQRSNDYTATWNQNMPVVESEIFTLGLLALVNYQHSYHSETTMGIDLEYTQGHQLSFQPLDFTTTGWNVDTFIAGEKFYDDTTTYTAISPYIQHNQLLLENITLTLGARYDYANYDFDNKLSVFGDIGHGKQSLTDRSNHFSHLSPKASVNYQVNDSASVYLRYANSFRLPTADSLYHLTNKDTGEAKPVDPEVSDTYELGYKAYIGELAFDAAIYYMDVDDGIVRAYNDAGQRYLTNANRVIHQGIEIAVNWQLTQSLNINLAYTHSQHEFDEDENFAGNDMKMAPNYITNARLTYKPEFLSGLTALLELQSIGKYWLDDANSQDDQGNDRKDDGYTIGNVKFRYQATSQLAIHARVINVTNKVYAQEVEYRYGRNAYSPGAPRTAYVGINYSW